VLVIFGLLAPAISLFILIGYYHLPGIKREFGPILFRDAVLVVYPLFGIPALICGFALWAWGALEGQSSWWKIPVGALINGLFDIGAWFVLFGGDLMPVWLIATIVGPPFIIPTAVCGFVARRFARQLGKAIPL
jgi:hypothetical protein